MPESDTGLLVQHRHGCGCPECQCIRREDARERKALQRQAEWWAELASRERESRRRREAA